MNEDEAEQTISTFASIDGLPGVVTGVDFDQHQNGLLSPATNRSIWKLCHFHGQVSSDFALLDVCRLSNINKLKAYAWIIAAHIVQRKLLKGAKHVV